jgi:predicted AAA+ superfamily ATPase
VPEYRRPVFDTILRRLREPRRFIQVLAGPRQVGKTTLALQAVEALDRPAHYASADDPVGRDTAWIEAQWDLGRLAAGRRGPGGVLVLDEIQKIPGWSEVVKRLWDEDTRRRIPLRVLLLGSAPLLVQRGLTESLAGRFELIHVTHWSFSEMREAFGWDLDRYLYFGGYPGSAPLVREPRRWASYIRDSLIETTISRDVLLLTRVDKPALLRQLFRLACEYSGQVLSYTKMLGQLQDAGNTTTLAHYLELLAGAGLAVGLEKFSGSAARRRGSSPKLLVLNTALITATSGLPFREARATPEVWGRLVESAVGAHLVNAGLEVSWWRERNREVDFVVRRGRSVFPIEVTSGRRKGSLPGMDAFTRTFRTTRRLLVGGQGLPLEEFLAHPAETWLR